MIQVSTNTSADENETEDEVDDTAGEPTVEDADTIVELTQAGRSRLLKVSRAQQEAGNLAAAAGPGVRHAKRQRTQPDTYKP